MRTFSMAAVACALWLCGPAQAQDCKEAGWQAPQHNAVAQGGRLYDNWWAVCGLTPPASTHPAYPATVGKQSGATTWRCKECHGWDYQGKDGAYGKGSHYTGIKGISAYAGRDEASIVALLKNETHQYGKVLSDETLDLIAQFVSKAQVDAGASIDAATKKVMGDQAVGRNIFENQCMACHGVKGRALNFSDKPTAPEYVGTIAQDNPWEMLHKIRNGQPGAVMDEQHMRQSANDPDQRGSHMRMRMHMLRGRAMPAQGPLLTLKEQLDLLSYLQTLPSR